MADVAALWNEILPLARQGVTGKGAWTALNACSPVAYENGTFVIGLPHNEAELGGHLRMAQTRRIIEEEAGRILGEKVTLRVIEGIAELDWETEKRRDQEKRKLQDKALQRARAELEARVSWESIYEQLSRKYAATPNRTLPQNRAKFFLEAVEVIAEGLLETPITDELAERNYARCIERVAQYAELPSAFVALKVLERSFTG